MAARSEAARLQTLRDAAAAMRIAYWADQLDIQAEVVRGLATCAEGNAAECRAILRAAAERAGDTAKAKRLAAQLLDQTAAADSHRPEVDVARRLAGG